MPFDAPQTIARTADEKRAFLAGLSSDTRVVKIIHADGTRPFLSSLFAFEVGAAMVEDGNIHLSPPDPISPEQAALDAAYCANVRRQMQERGYD